MAGQRKIAGSWMLCIKWVFQSKECMSVWGAQGRPSVRSCPWGLTGSALKFCQGHRVIMPGHAIAIKWELPWLPFLNSLLARNPNGVRTEGGGREKIRCWPSPPTQLETLHMQWVQAGREGEDSPLSGGCSCVLYVRLDIEWNHLYFLGKNENSQQTPLYLILKEVRDNGSQK